MAYYNEGQDEIGIVSAVETLTSIADLEVDSPIAVAEKHEVELQELPIIYRTVHWLHRKNAERVMAVVCDTYKVILNYLRHFYKKEHGKLVKHESIEGIKTIMVLVGEAAKKVDKYTRLFAGTAVLSVKETPEFRNLVTFYQRKIAPIAVQDSLTTWLHTLPLQNVVEVKQAALPVGLPKGADHLFIDLDSVKRDSEYELFLIRKQDGSRFFNPRLLRNMKLVCNFEQYVQNEEVPVVEHDPVYELKIWRDQAAQCVARNIVRQNWHIIDQFIKACSKYYNHELSMMLYRGVIALMLAASRSPSPKEFSKGASDYLKDFLFFMRAFLASGDFQRLVTYPPKDENSIYFKLLFLAHEIARELFFGFHTSRDLSVLINYLVTSGQKEIEKQEPHHEQGLLPLSTRMVLDYDALMVAMQRFHHAPLVQTIEMLQHSDLTAFDSLLLQNIPGCIFDLFPKSNRIAVLRLPSPTTQEYIHKASISEEFKACIRSLVHDPQHKKLLLFNLQDRTGWKEFARCQALEEMQKKEEFHKALCVVSMTKESDFYYQSGPYVELNHAATFIEQLIEHVQSENTGFYYPQPISKALFSGFAEKLAGVIHELFFAKKNVLSRHARMDFIEIFYLLIQLKILELVGPSSISFTCKDGIDVSAAASVELFLLLKLFNTRPLSESEEEYLKLVLYSQSILVRSRILFLDRFTRLSSLIKVLESVINDLGEKDFHHAVVTKLQPLFDKGVLTSVVTIPQPLQ